jgi:hypothetical protein
MSHRAHGDALGPTRLTLARARSMHLVHRTPAGLPVARPLAAPRPGPPRPTSDCGGAVPRRCPGFKAVVSPTFSHHSSSSSGRAVVIEERERERETISGVESSGGGGGGCCSDVGLGLRRGKTAVRERCLLAARTEAPAGWLGDSQGEESCRTLGSSSLLVIRLAFLVFLPCPALRRVPVFIAAKDVRISVHTLVSHEINLLVLLTVSSLAPILVAASNDCTIIPHFRNSALPILLPTFQFSYLHFAFF